MEFLIDRSARRLFCAAQRPGSVCTSAKSFNIWGKVCMYNTINGLGTIGFWKGEELLVFQKHIDTIATILFKEKDMKKIILLGNFRIFNSTSFFLLK